MLKILFLRPVDLFLEEQRLQCDEDYEKNPISPYGSSKLAIESFCNSYASVYDINTTILRFSNAYGNHSFHKK